MPSGRCGLPGDRFFELDSTVYKLCNSQSGLKASIRQAIQPALEGIVRDIFGNPFRSVTFSPKWRTDTAVALARRLYDSRAFDRMPILADALQDAGCESSDILDHCRDENQIHVRGCWVVDLVLGKK